MTISHWRPILEAISKIQASFQRAAKTSNDVLLPKETPLVLLSQFVLVGWSCVALESGVLTGLCNEKYN